MSNLRKKFGILVAAHRRRRGMTQKELAKAANLSPDMVGKIENGANGCRFPVLKRLAEALEVDPAELFTSQLPGGLMSRGVYGDVLLRLTSLSEPELTKVFLILEAIRGGLPASNDGACVASASGFAPPADVANRALRRPRKIAP